MLLSVTFMIYHKLNFYTSVQFSCSVMSDSLQPHEPQHARPPCPSPTPGVHPNPCPLSQWCHPTISSSVVPFSSCPQSFPASGSFQMSQLFEWGDQSFSFSISPSNEHPGLISFRMDWLDLLAVQGTLKSLLQHHSSKASILQHSAFFIVQLSWYEVNINSHFFQKISKIIQHHLLKISFSIDLCQQLNIYTWINLDSLLFHWSVCLCHTNIKSVTVVYNRSYQS